MEAATTGTARAQLIVSVSGIRERTRAAAMALAAEMDQRGVPLSLLVAPGLPGRYRLLDDAPTMAWLHARRAAGDSIVLHGYDQATPLRRAEFAKLPRHEARLRLMAADRALEHAGLGSRLFAPPRWVASEGALAALHDLGFHLAITMTAVHDLPRGVTERAWVHGIGDGFRAEPWWCHALVMTAGRIARRGGLLRLAVSAGQLDRSGPRQAVLDAVDLALLHHAQPTVYRWEPIVTAAAA